ncbi:MAG: DUF1631 family protein [Bacteriovorax sp.]|nr:DUF1631 family protein [Rhizobacter sp.]
MTTPLELRLQAALDAATTEVRKTVASVAERVAEHLAVSAQTSSRISERDTLISAQFDLRRNAVEFRRVFDNELQERLEREISPRQESGRKLAAADWLTLSLVDDSEMEERMFSDRIGQQISHASEVELREMAAYMGSLLNTGRADQDRNPLRAELLGAALYRAVEAVSDQAEIRKLLARELGLGMARAMPDCYARILRDLQSRGVTPVSLSVRTVEGPGNQLPGMISGYASLTGRRSQAGDIDAPSSSGTGGGGSGSTGPATNYGTRTGSGVGPASSHGSAPGSGSRGSAGQRSGAASHQSEAQLMALLRRLTAIASRPGDFDALARASASSPNPASRRNDGEAFADTPPESPAGQAYGTEGLTGLMAVNLIRAHREELVQASTGKLDHMVIDVVGSLFDQILSDTRVPPQMARQIARLQLPVLRVALNDSNFFSSRRHPVRRFVNRIASLACAFDDFDDGPGKQFLTRVRELVQEIVEGDFDQIDLYSAKLAALESFIGEQTRVEVQEKGAVSTLNTKESELRLQQRYMLQLQAALAPLSLPPYLRGFLPQVWSQALVLAVSRDGPDSDRAQRYRRVGRDVVMSVQPKGSPALRKKFLMQLPSLMKDLNEGLQLIGWPESAQREFFGQLLPAHAESLKGQALSELDHNMMVKQLEAVFNIAVPGIESLSAADPVPEVDNAVLARRFSPEEAERVGLVSESAVDWSGTVDIDLSAEADASAVADTGADDASITGLGASVNLDLASTEPAEPTRGPGLIDHIKLGFAYQMHLKDEWQKVRLAHVSAGRSFFVFTTGRKHQETISMTARMLARMCETNRMRAVESAYLMERATHRARKQLAAMKVPPSRH